MANTKKYDSLIRKLINFEEAELEAIKDVLKPGESVIMFVGDACRKEVAYRLRKAERD